MKHNRTASFIFILIVYILASVLGIVLMNMLPYSAPISLLIADIAATVLVFLFSVVMGNASVYDPYWSVAPIVIVWGLAAVYPMNTAALLISLVVTGWGIRLTANWAYTFRDLTHQDWRYTMLHDTCGVFYPLINFIGIHMVPTLIVYGCILPVWFVYASDAACCTGLTVLFSCGAIAAFLMQGLADIQMHRFRKQHTGTFIRTGLWKYSRHPNYLGEILMWWFTGLACCFSLPEFRPELLIGALFNTILFLTVSIPMAEGHQKKRKLGFDAYKHETRMLLPLPKLR